MQQDFGFGDENKWDGKFEMISCSRALSPSKLPGITYALNPYGGCEHGCVYCYAPEVTHKPWNEWRIVKVKYDIPQRLQKELPQVEGIIGVGTVTDPYQAAEARFELTKKCLEILQMKNYYAHLHTKSDLILRDLDLIKKMRIKVGITITNHENKPSLIMEPGAPLPEVRLSTLKTLIDNNVDQYALIEPILPFIEGKEKQFCQRIIDTGIEKVYVGKLNLRPELSQRLERMNVNLKTDQEAKIREIFFDNGIAVFNAL